MNAHYKGTPTPIQAVLPGTPVEITDRSALVQSYLPADAGGPLVGVLTAQNKSVASLLTWGPGYPNGRLWNLYERHYSNLPTTPFLNVLTGTKAAALRRAYTDHIRNHQALSHTTSIRSGSDPEMFVVGGDGVMIPAWTFLPSKSNRAFPTSPYWDGAQAEFCPEPRNCCEEFATQLQRGMDSLLGSARRVDPKAHLSLAGVMDLPAGTIESAEPRHLALGCSPSLNAYGAEGEHPPAGAGLPFRFAGGHLHFGVGREVQAQAPRIVKALDRVLGVASVGLFQEIDNPLRRRFYGLAGEYRLPHHGIEYRVLSPAWLCHPAIYFLVYDLARCVLSAEYNGWLHQLLTPISEGEVQRIINEGDAQAAYAYVKENRRFFERFHTSYYRTRPEDVGIFLEMVEKGVGARVSLTPKAFESVWGLNGEYFHNGDGPKGDCRYGAWFRRQVTERSAAA